MKKISFLLFIVLLTVIHCYSQVYNKLYPVEIPPTPPMINGPNAAPHYGYVSLDGKLILDCGSGGGRYFMNGYAEKYSDRKVGLIDTTGAWAVPPVFNDILGWKDAPVWEARIFPDSITVFGEHGKVICAGYGEMVLGSKDINRIIINNLGRGKHNISAALFDFNGNKHAEFVAPKGQSVQLDVFRHDNGPAINKHSLYLSRGTLPGAITDTNGKIFFDSVSGAGFYNGYMMLNGPGKAALIDTNLRQTIPFNAGYQAIRGMQYIPYYYNVMKDSLWGIVDTAMHIIVECN